LSKGLFTISLQLIFELRGLGKPLFLINIYFIVGEISTNIEDLLSRELDGNEVFLVEVEELPNQLIRVYIDSDKGLKISECARISRILENHLESEGLVPEKYNLEVSSPGVGNPLKFKRQYYKHLGRTLKIELVDGSKVEGVLCELDEEWIKLKPKSKKDNIESYLFNDIKETRVKLSFK
jgi:ribosome maturation factor RimP